MDTTLKARLIGATVLVALAVLLIPELLSGRKPLDSATAQPEGTRGTRTFTIELGNPAGDPAKTRQAPDPSAAPLPAPTTGATAKQVPREVPKEVPEESATETTSETSTGAEPRPGAAAQGQPAAQRVEMVTDSRPEPSPAPVVPARGGWAVQVGAFASAEAATKLVRQLQAANYTAYVSPVSRGGKTLHRVRIGPSAERSSSETLVAGLKARGLPATVVAND
jgi:DedD protein